VERGNGVRGRYVINANISLDAYKLTRRNKASKLAKEYEKKGGGYENEAGSKNEPKKGEPRKKAQGKRKAEEKEVEK